MRRCQRAGEGNNLLYDGGDNNHLRLTLPESELNFEKGTDAAVSWHTGSGTKSFDGA
jgi:hypothetical protein